MTPSDANREIHYVGLALCLAIGYAAFASYLSILQHHGLRTQLRDLGHYTQALHQLTLGNFLMPLSHPELGLSRLAEHRDFILYLIAPLYWLCPSPEMLLVLQSVCVAAGSIVVFFLGRSVDLSSSISLVFSSTLLISPFIHSANLYDFHTITLSVLFLPIFLLSIEKQSRAWTAISLSLLLSLKEDMALVVIFLSPLIWRRWKPKVALITATAAITFFTINWWGLPWYFEWKVSSPHWFRYSYLGDSPLDVFKNFFSAPGIFIGRLAQPIPLQYLMLVALCGLPLAIFAPYAFLMAIPNLAQNLLDRTNFQARIATTYYSAIVITAIICASIYGFKFLYKRKSGLAKFLLSIFAFTQLALSMILSPAPYSVFSSWSDFSAHHDQVQFAKIASLIPKEAALATQNNLGAQFADRNLIFEYPKYLDKTEYVLLFLGDPSYYDNGLFMRSPGFYIGRSLDKFWEKVMPLFSNPDFGVYAYSPPFYLFKRGAPRESISEVRRLVWQDYLGLTRKRDRSGKEYLWLLNADWLRRAESSQSYPKQSEESERVPQSDLES